MRARERVAAGVGQSVGGGARALRRLTRASLGSLDPPDKEGEYVRVYSFPQSLSRSREADAAALRKSSTHRRARPSSHEGRLNLPKIFHPGVSAWAMVPHTPESGTPPNPTVSEHAALFRV